MKITVSILFLLMSVISTVFAQSEISDKKIIGHTDTLSGKIISKVDLTPHCGHIAWGTVVELEVLSFSDSSYHDKNIAVIFTCPEFYGDNFFMIGRVYRIIVADKNQAAFTWLVPNEYILKKYPNGKVWYVISADRINK